MKLEVLLAKKFITLVKTGAIDDKLAIAMYNNFVKPIKNGFNLDELAGKYKPSWEYKGTTSSRHNKWLRDAETNALHHYHVGYLYYKPGNDADYPGDESEGLIHTKIRQDGDMQTHIVFRADTSHPIPFSFNYNANTDFATS